MIPTRGVFPAKVGSFAILAFAPREADILRCFSARRDLCALFPIMAELPDQIERAGDENGVLGRCFGKKVVECLLGFGDNRAVTGMVRRDLAELRSRNGAR